MYVHIIKRFSDCLIAFVGLCLSSPVLLIIILLLLISNKGKPFFLQRRPGKNEKIFKIIKFKTMNDQKDKDGNLLSDAGRMTPIGEFIRKTSLDEIPQLINVLKGDMSLIGPRPLLPEYLPLYSIKQKKRHLVRPGISGWAQVNGRNAISWQKKFELDIWYVDHISFLVDLRILLMTIKKVLKSENINASGTATTIPFKGNDKL